MGVRHERVRAAHPAGQSGVTMWLHVPGCTFSNSAPDTAGSLSDSDSPSHRLEQSVTWRGKHTPSRFWSRRWSVGGWIRLLSGATLPPSTASCGVERWISSLRGFRASRSAQPASDSAKPTSDGSGPTSRGSSARFGRGGSSSRTSVWTLFDDPELTWRIWATESRQRSASVRRMLERRTGGSDGGAWLPTPTARDYRSGKASDATHARNARPLNEVVRRIPTPTAGDSRSSGSRNLPGSKANPGVSLTDWVKTGCSTQPRVSASTGDLNPTWVDWLMGLPTGWTACEPSETESSPSASPPPGASSRQA